MNQFLATLEQYGYSVPQEDYETWARKVEAYVEAGDDKEELALLGLYHMVTSNLPEASKAPMLEDQNAQAALEADKEFTVDEEGPAGVTAEAVGSYLAFLVARGFMQKPEKGELPKIELGEKQVEALNKVGGRGGSS
jgi:L-aminoadipate-semialdehyde dehydrogenase